MATDSVIPIIPIRQMIPLALLVGMTLSGVAAESLDLRAEEILKQCIEATGGREAMTKLTSRRLAGQLIRNGASVPFTRSHKIPNRFQSETHFPKPGTLKQGFDGERAWIDHPRQGVRLLNGAQKDNFATEAILHPLLKIRSTYAERVYVGEAVYGDRTHSVLNLTRKGSDQPERWAFDSETKLLSRIEKTIDGGPHGSIRITFEFSDYRTRDSIQVPFRIRTVMPTFDIVLKVETLTHNVDLDDALFQVPLK